MYSTSLVRKLPRHFSPTDTFYCELSEIQAKTLAYLLPKACSIVQQSKSQLKPLPPRPKQEINPYSSAAFQTSLPKHTTHKETSQPKQPPKPQPKKTPKQQIPETLKPMIPILQQLKSHKHSWPFLQPVDAQTLGIPEYYQIVKQPIDLSKIQLKLKSAKYSTPQQFYRDVNTMIKNSYLFNSANQDFLKLTNQFQRYFWRIAGPDSKSSNDKKLQKEKQKQRERLEKQRLKEEKIKQKIMEKQKQRQRKLLLQQQQQAELALKQAKKKKKFIPKDLLQAQNISVEQKQQLANSIHSLSKQHLKGIRQIVFTTQKQQDGQPSVQRHQNMHQFDIEKIGYKKIRQLQRYVRGKLSEMENAKFSDEMVEKKHEVDLDEMESEWTEEFVE